jgi:hypothetical protein
VQEECHGDIAVLLSSGFPIQKPAHYPIGKLPTPGAPVLSLGDYSGELVGDTPPIYGAATYNWQLALASALGQRAKCDCAGGGDHGHHRDLCRSDSRTNLSSPSQCGGHRRHDGLESAGGVDGGLIHGRNQRPILSWQRIVSCRLDIWPGPFSVGAL